MDYSYARNPLENEGPSPTEQSVLPTNADGYVDFRNEDIGFTWVDKMDRGYLGRTQGGDLRASEANPYGHNKLGATKFQPRNTRPDERDMRASQNTPASRILKDTYGPRPDYDLGPSLNNHGLGATMIARSQGGGIGGTRQSIPPDYDSSQRQDYIRMSQRQTVPKQPNSFDNIGSSTKNRGHSNNKKSKKASGKYDYSDNQMRRSENEGRDFRKTGYPQPLAQTKLSTLGEESEAGDLGPPFGFAPMTKTNDSAMFEGKYTWKTMMCDKAKMNSIYRQFDQVSWCAPFHFFLR